MRNLRLSLVLGLIALTALVLLPFQILGLLCVPWLARKIPVLFHKVVLFLMAVRVEISGYPARERPLLLIANHLSWLDIVVLSSVLPVSFVAKAEMKNWPVFGQLARLQRTIFVKREARRRTGDQANEIADRLTMKDTIVLFPEGTTSDGHGLYPFKTSLFEAARFALVTSEQDHAFVQPVALDYTHIHGLPLGRQWRQQVAWPGEVGIGEHMIPLIRKGAVDVTVHFGEPIHFTAESNRKVVAVQAREAIREMLQSEN